jgi:hypothetical protein
MGIVQPNAFRYHDHRARDEMLWRLGIASLFLFSALTTVVWGVASLLHANWLNTNHLPIGNYQFWGVSLLCLAAVQATTAVLLVFNRMLGSVAGIVLAIVSILAQASIIRAFPVDSIVGIAANLLIITVLALTMHRH